MNLTLQAKTTVLRIARLVEDILRSIYKRTRENKSYLLLLTPPVRMNQKASPSLL